MSCRHAALLLSVVQPDAPRQTTRWVWVLDPSQAPAYLGEYDKMAKILLAPNDCWFYKPAKELRDADRGMQHRSQKDRLQRIRVCDLQGFSPELHFVDIYALRI